MGSILSRSKTNWPCAAWSVVQYLYLLASCTSCDKWLKGLSTLLFFKFKGPHMLYFSILEFAGGLESVAGLFSTTMVKFYFMTSWISF